jgi:hypothetical protein
LKHSAPAVRIGPTAKRGDLSHLGHGLRRITLRVSSDDFMIDSVSGTNIARSANTVAIVSHGAGGIG